MKRLSKKKIVLGTVGGSLFLIILTLVLWNHGSKAEAQFCVAYELSSCQTPPCTCPGTLINEVPSTNHISGWEIALCSNP